MHCIPDLLVAFYVKDHLQMRPRPAGYGAALAPDHYEVGTLAVDSVAARLNRAV
ncbi:MAG: hypothetical protein IH937_10995 [Acidobacteria bacterium]|nr:hypothetical protein [Acidobacteriota bacterium]